MDDLEKPDISKIDNAFDKLLGGDEKATNTLEMEFSKFCKSNVTVKLSNVDPKTQKGIIPFVMCVYPDQSTMDKLAKAIYNGSSNLGMIQAIWASSKGWTMEIDRKILEFLSVRELTALSLHELGHITHSMEIPTRLHNVVQFQFASLGTKMESMLNKLKIRRILQIPIAAACYYRRNPNHAELKKEIQADHVAVSYGYRSDLVSAITKIEQHLKSDFSNNLEESVKYSTRVLENLSNRKSELVKNDLLAFRDHLESGLLKSHLESVCDSWDVESGNFHTFVENAADLFQPKYYMEFGHRRLEAITTNQIDFIQVKIEQMNDYNTKMMVLSYINSKLDLITYYKGILTNRRLSKKYKVPHSITDLEAKEKRLLSLRDIAMKKEIKLEQPTILVTYPSGYDG